MSMSGNGNVSWDERRRIIKYMRTKCHKRYPAMFVSRPFAKVMHANSVIHITIDKE
jgi:hypothetical protein